MTNEPVYPILALGLEGLEHARRQFAYRLWWHVATLFLLSIVALAVTSLHGLQPQSVVFAIECTGAGLAVLTELIALRTHHRAMEAHSLGRQVMRRVMLLDARRPEDAKEYLAHIRTVFPESVRHGADKRFADDPQPGHAQYQLQRYYASTREVGLERLRDHVLESAMFSQRLYQTGFNFSIAVLSGFLLSTALVITLMLIRGFRPGAHEGELGVRLMIAVLAFIPASQELDHALLYRMMSEQLKSLVKRVELLWDPAIARDQLDLRLTADVGDYGANTTFAPPIRTIVYKWLNSELNNEVIARIKQLDKQAERGPK